MSGIKKVLIIGMCAINERVSVVFVNKNKIKTKIIFNFVNANKIKTKIKSRTGTK